MSAYLFHQTGLRVARGDEAGLAAALGRLLSEPGLRRAMGAAGRQAYEQHFTAARSVAATAAVYRELAREEGWPLPSPVPDARAAGGAR